MNELCLIAEVTSFSALSENGYLYQISSEAHDAIRYVSVPKQNNSPPISDGHIFSLGRFS